MKTIEVNKLIYGAHAVIYISVLILSFLVSGFRGSSEWFGSVGAVFLIGMLWGIIFAFHTYHYAKQGSKYKDSGLERQAYRDGFNDAMREAREREERLSQRRYVSADELIGEDGELYEEIPQEKHKRNY